VWELKALRLLSDAQSAAGQVSAAHTTVQSANRLAERVAEADEVRL
jgi:hypothetical protein